MGQSAFYYYNPDPSSDSRQHGHFSQQHPHIQPQMYHIPSIPSTPIYSRPSSSCSQPPMPMHMYNQNFVASAPMFSPKPMYQKPTIVMNENMPRVMSQEQYDPEMFFGPCTPPLSSSGSAMSSPSSAQGLQTPMDNATFYFSVEGVKEGCMGEVEGENLAGEWANCGSPPMTPGMFCQTIDEISRGVTDKFRV